MDNEKLPLEICNSHINSVKDALYVLSGKWKLPLIVALMNGPGRFKDIQRSLNDITPKMLSKELRELELNDLVQRKVFNTVPVSITYELTPYSQTVLPIIQALGDWGKQHRKKLIEERRIEALKQA
ncbi:MAG: winged helix-turn-helix transcriptional regulator [Mucilaginibacter sp.]